MILHLLPIAATGVVAAALIAERTSKLFFQYSIDSKLFMSQIEGLLQKGNLQGALDLCAANEQKLLPRVVKAALLKASRNQEEIKTSLEVAVIDANSLLSARIGYLAMIANVATLLGLLGTIAGLIQSFKAVASADAATKQSLLAEGISVSMNATGLGLVVAIPAMIAFSLLSGRSNKILDEIEKGAGRTLSLLHNRVYAGEDDFSNVSFDTVETGNGSGIKGAA
ncbi:MAG TPA: MotA/TolQ/ExbB proton channel family protein [Oligoflexia bacterium]|nr:MotA/TolQ/ExbB proton channel family protein [Oligoflexia bacterium]